MAATDPGQAIHEFAALFNKGDVDGLVDIYEDDAVFKPSPADEPLVGKDAIRAALEGFLGLNGTISIIATSIVQCGDIALTQSRWRLEIPGGDPMEQESAEVIRRQADGTWMYAIDNPWGALILG
jgi:ketosteroid isomerase-like protein